jgi:type IV pilus assembly protein PilE
MHVKKNKQSGFTLIELLIVIIIIGILAAIAFVAYTGSQQKAHKASAQSELSEMQNKLSEYNADNGYFPTTQSVFATWLTSSDGGNNTTISGLLTASPSGYTYTATPASCDNSATTCTGYSITASASNLDFTGGDITVQN